MGYMERLKKTQDRFKRRKAEQTMGNVHTFGQQLQSLAGATPNVPIIGQPFVLEAWFVQLLITCNCERPKPVLIVGQPGAAGGVCSACGKTYVLQAIGLNPNGQPSFNVAVVLPRETQDGEQGVQP